MLLNFRNNSKIFIALITIICAQVLFIPSSSAAISSITVVVSGGANQGTGWDVTSGVLTSTTSVSINSSEISTLLNNGNLVIDAATLTINDSITASNGFNLTLKSQGNTIIAGGVEIRTAGGHIIFQSDSDNSGSGSTRLGSFADANTGKIVSSGGNITFSGGTDISSGFAKASSDIASSGGTSKPRAGVAIYGFAIEAEGGNITIRGSGGTQISSTRAVLIESNTRGRATFSTTGSGSIDVTGDGRSIAIGNAWGVTFSGVNFSTATGSISIVGLGNTAYSNARGIVSSAANYSSTSGTITLIDETSGAAGNYSGSYFGSPNIFSTNNTVMIKSDEVVSDSTAKLTLTCSAATIQAYSSASFTATPSFGEIAGTDCQELNIGASGNTSSLTFGQPINIGGTINLNGASISLNSSISSSTNLSLISSGSVTQTGKITASGLKLTGVGTFTLNESNTVSTLSAGSSGSRIGSISFVNSGELTVGSVSTSTGIYSSETITISTSTGNLNISEVISSTAGTGDRVILYANKLQPSGNAGTGNITFTGNGALSIESGARALLYSGSRPESSGLVTIVGGEENTRSLIDSATVLSSISPALTSSGKFALFRTNTPSQTTSSGGNSYCASPSITGLSVDGGKSTGGTQIEINGQNLTSSITIGGKSVTITSMSSNMVSIITPPGTKGKTAILMQGCGTITDADFIYDPEPKIERLSSQFISSQGSVFEISGKYLEDSVITLDETRVNILVNTDTLIVASTPITKPGLKKFILFTTFGKTDFSLTSINPPVISSQQNFPYMAKGDKILLSLAAINVESFSHSGKLPNGLTLNPATGEISGTLQEVGVFDFEIIGINKVGVSAKRFSATVDYPAPTSKSINLYFGYKKNQLNPDNEKSLNRLLLKIPVNTPRLLKPTLTILGSAGSSNQLGESAIRDEIEAFFNGFGISFEQVRTGVGKNNRLSLIISWERGN